MPSKYLRKCKCEREEDERTPENLFLSVLYPHLSKNSLVLCGSKMHDRFFIMKFHSVIYNQLCAEAYRPAAEILATTLESKSN